MSKVVLITGASSGIGKETALQLLDRGHRVYAAARRLELMEDLKQRGARVLGLDITDDVAVTGAVAGILKETSGIDVLVNNAGYGSTGALEDVPLSEAKDQFAVNVFGLVRLTQLVLPQMRARGSGTIINLSSVGGRLATPLSGWYNATKYSVEALSDSLRLEVKPFGIDVVIIEPGGIQTGWGALAASNAVKNSGHTVYRHMVEKLLGGFKQYDARLSDPKVIGRLIVRAIEARRPRVRYVGGFMARPALLAKKVMPTRWLDAMIGGQFK
jgi:NAD(P)-dependent dehydrogenase (short-subunit alcohol dehydrogenase family)